MNDVNDQSSSDSAEPELKRRGDIDRCPVCGSGIDPAAYHCAACQNDFCFHCRARLLPADVQLECVNQDCGYYGKLICSVCDGKVEYEEEPAIYNEPEDGYWPALLIVAIVLMGVTWYFSTFLMALLLATCLYVGGGLLLHFSGLNVFGREREVQHQRRSSKYNCIRCGVPAKKLVVPNV